MHRLETLGEKEAKGVKGGQRVNAVEGGRLSGRQLAAVLILSRVVPITIAFPAITGIEVPQDAWIAALLGTLLAIPFAILVVRLGLRYPDKTIIQYSEVLLGRYLGKLVGLVLILYWIQTAATVLRACGEAYTTAVMPETPLPVFTIIMAFLAANAARHGLELVGRTGEMVAWIVLFFLVLMSVLPYDVMRFRNLAPVLPRGLRPLAEPTGTVLALFLQIVVIGMAIPYLGRQREATRVSVNAVVVSGLLMTWLAADLVAVFGPTVSGLTMATFSLARMVSIANFFERMEAITIGVWTLSLWIKLAFFLWAAAVGLAQLFDVPDYRPLLYPLGAIVIVFGELSFKSIVEREVFYEFRYFGVFSFTVALGTLAILQLAAFIRGRAASRAGR